MDFAHYQSLKLLGSIPPIANKHGVSRKHEWFRQTYFFVGFRRLLSRISYPRGIEEWYGVLVGFSFFRMENLALTSTRTQIYRERRSMSSCASMLLYKCYYSGVQDSIFGALSISRQIHNRENLGQTSGDYPIYLFFVFLFHLMAWAN